MDTTTTHHIVRASGIRVAQLRGAAVGAIALAPIAASMLAWAVILDRALSTLR